MSYEEAIQNILKFVEEESGDEEVIWMSCTEMKMKSIQTQIFPVRVATLKKKMMTLTQMKMQILSLDVNIGVSN